MVPKLRFSQFQAAWSLKKLGEIGDIINGLTYSPENIRESGLLVLRSSNIQDGKLCFDDSVYVNQTVAEEKKTKENDILICVRNGSRALIGKSTLIKGLEKEATHGAFMTVFRSPLNDYVAQLLKTKRFFCQVYSDLGATINSINGGNFKKYLFSFPSDSDEVTKIADFLSSVDEKIMLLSKQHELLCQYKKGMMQKIFSQELRFKDNNGGEFPKWDMRKFSDFFAIGSSKRVLQDDWVNEGVPFYRTRELVSLSKKEKFKSEIFITEDNYTYLKDKYGIPAIGDFLVSGVGTLGIIHQIKNDNPFYFKDGNVLWFRKNNEISSDFFYQVFNSPKVITQIVDHAAITTVGTYTIENAKKTKFMCPSLDEQTKIANFLSAIDDKITAKKTELDKLKIWKQGLLQQMFV